VNREGQALNTLVAAAIILLLGDPAWLFSVGFQLSFAAVLSILIFYQPIYRLWPQSGWMGNRSWQAVSASIAAEVLTAPLVIYYFHNFPLVFILANLLSVVLVGLFALIGGMAIIALCWIPPLARVIGWTITQCVSFFNMAIRWLQQVSPNALQFLQINAVELVLLYLLIAGLGICWLTKEKRAWWLALPAACTLMLLFSVDTYQALSQQKLVVYNNGRNELVELIDGKHSIPLAGELAENYNTRAAHTGWHAWKTSEAREENPVHVINGQTVFLLKDTTIQAYALSFPVDVLVVCRSLRSLQVRRILQAFSPKEVVLAQRPSKDHLQRWKDSCVAHNAHLYNVAEDGAFIME
jgi:competence protein ComEC